MRHLLDMIHWDAPAAGKEMPVYFRRALATSEVILGVYFLLNYILFSWMNHHMEWMPLLLCAGILLSRYFNGHINCRLSFYAFELIIVLWCGWNSYAVGWSYGAQHLLIPMLMLCFFNIYEPPWLKIFTFLMALAYRMLLFAYGLDHAPVYVIPRDTVIIFQTMNTLTLFNVLGVCFIVFSTSIQERERQLLLNNQELHREAGTDPLTQLPNRRAMLDEIQKYLKETPDVTFAIAIADIDFFKKVNDTYGHNCGDYTLKELSALFLERSTDKYKVCRWGGEEFCFFMPGINLDEAGKVMHDLHIAVRKMPLSFDGTDFSITVTIGIEEYDFQSSLDTILEKADRKLYQGKVSGRDQVVF